MKGKNCHITFSFFLSLQVVQVAALEVQNVKRAINRYGTLPKGARIGAYLESLRASGLTSGQEVEGAVTDGGEADCIEEPVEMSDLIPHRSVSPRTSIRTQPQMIRSNSSGGVVGGFHHHPPAPSSPTAGKLHRPRTGVVRSHGVEICGSLRTFRAAPGTSSFRGGSPSHVLQPSLADLEFPPPPADLPPPPEEFDSLNDDPPVTQELPPPLTAVSPSPERRCLWTGPPGNKPSALASSPHSLRKLGHSSSLDQPTSRWPVQGDATDSEQVMMVEQQSDPDKDSPGSSRTADVRNTEPSVEEASSRFGVSLRHREPSTDSCSSAKSGGDHDDSVAQLQGCGRRSSKNRPRDRPPSPPRSSRSLTSPSLETKSPVSPSSDLVPALYSPTELLTEPTTSLQQNTVCSETIGPSSEEHGEKKTGNNKVPILGMKEMLELKLVAEIKERADLKFGRTGLRESPVSEVAGMPGSTSTLDPTVQLVSELSERFQYSESTKKDLKETTPDTPPNKSSSDPNKGPTSPVDFKANLRRVSRGSEGGKPESAGQVKQDGITLGSFKAQLKKFEPASKWGGAKDENEDHAGSIIDFKSRLRKVESSGDKVVAAGKRSEGGKEDEDDRREEEQWQNSVNLDGDHQQEEDPSKKRDSTVSAQSLDSGTEGGTQLKVEEGDDKRCSTGSISSLKKLWESKETSEVPACSGLAGQVSPKLALKVPGRVRETASTAEEEDRLKGDEGVKEQGSLLDDGKPVNKGQRVWPPPPIPVDEKPMVPTKPPVRVTKPILSASKLPTGSAAIYATPTLPKPPIVARETKSVTEEEGSAAPASGVGGGERESVLEISQALETSLTCLRSASTVSTGSWLQLSDKVSLFHSSCVGYVDSIVPPHARFHFRELLTRLENQVHQLRSAGARNLADNTRLCAEVQNTVRDVINAVQR